MNTNFISIRAHMESIGTGYDLGTSQFSPEGRVFQVEYAQKAADLSGTAVALRGKDGVVLAVENLATCKLYESSANRRIFTIDGHIGVAVTGFVADGRQIVEAARTEASAYRSDYNKEAPIKYLKDHLALHMHAYTLSSSFRPFGASVLMISCDYDEPQIYCIDPSGIALGYFACAIGKAKQAAKTEMEALELKNMTCFQLAKEAAKIIYLVHDEIKDKNFELELSWVGKETSGRHELVPPSIFKKAEKYAKEAVEDPSSDEET